MWRIDLRSPVVATPASRFDVRTAVLLVSASVVTTLRCPQPSSPTYVVVVVLPAALKGSARGRSNDTSARDSAASSAHAEEAFFVFGDMARICETVTATDDGGTAAARATARSAPTWSNCASTASPTSTSPARSPAGEPVIVTCRPTWEGGAFRGQRRRAAAAARTARSTLGAEYVDVEWRARSHRLCRRATARAIVLSHPRLRRRAGGPGRARVRRCARRRRRRRSRSR